VYGETVWPVDEPRQGPPGGRPLPWAGILELVSQVTPREGRTSPRTMPS
jgi:hypothetical protein